jgi:molybdopterin-guanine dinucleotide biosynthesis protein A
MERPRVVGLLLAGGQGRRLDKAKGWREVGGVPIVRRALAALAAVSDEIVAVGDAELPADLPLRRIADQTPGAGPLAAMLTGMGAAPADLYVVLAWDMPFVTAELLQHLVAACAGVDAVVPHVAGRDQPLCAVYAASCRPAIERTRAEGVAKVGAFLEQVAVKRPGEDELGRFGDPERLFLNVNTPADLARAESLTTPAATPPHAPRSTRTGRGCP